MIVYMSCCVLIIMYLGQDEVGGPTNITELEVTAKNVIPIPVYCSPQLNLGCYC